MRQPPNVGGPPPVGIGAGGAGGPAGGAVGPIGGTGGAGGPIGGAGGAGGPTGCAGGVIPSMGGAGGPEGFLFLKVELRPPRLTFCEGEAEATEIWVCTSDSLFSNA